jgi:hypothetical protein
MPALVASGLDAGRRGGQWEKEIGLGRAPSALTQPGVKPPVD